MSDKFLDDDYSVFDDDEGGNVDTTSFASRWAMRQLVISHEKRAAKRCGLKHAPYVILRSLEDGQPHDYHDIARDTGIHSNLPGYLRERHYGSLGSQGLVREDVFLTESIQKQDRGQMRRVPIFTITQEGLRLLKLAEQEEPKVNSQK